MLKKLNEDHGNDTYSNTTLISVGLAYYEILRAKVCKARLPNDPMLKIWLRNKCSQTILKNRGLSSNSLWIPSFRTLVHLFYAKSKSDI